MCSRGLWALGGVLPSSGGGYRRGKMLPIAHHNQEREAKSSFS